MWRFKPKWEDEMGKDIKIKKKREKKRWKERNLIVYFRYMFCVCVETCK